MRLGPGRPVHGEPWDILMRCVPEYTPKDGVMDWVALQEGEI